MKYKVGEEVVLRDDLKKGVMYGSIKNKKGIEKEKGKPIKIKSVLNTGDTGFIYSTSAGVVISDEMIDHNKTAELQQKKAHDEYTKALMKYGRVEGDNLDSIKPKHYRKGMDDLFESWYRTRPFNEYRAIMESIAERYMKRAKDNRMEDLDKAIYTLERLKEKELETNG